MNLYRNAEGYYSPTEGQALANIMREERRKKREETIAHGAYHLAWTRAKNQKNRRKPNAEHLYPKRQG